MSIIDNEDPQSIIRLGTIQAWMFRFNLVIIPTVFAWIVAFSLWVFFKVVKHDSDIAVIQMQITMMQASGGKGVSQSVNVGQTTEPETELVKTSRDYITTADIAAREHVSERAVLEWISAGRIQPQPVKNGKAWTIAKNFRILPQDAEECGETPQD